MKITKRDNSKETQAMKSNKLFTLPARVVVKEMGEISHLSTHRFKIHFEFKAEGSIWRQEFYVSSSGYASLAIGDTVEFTLSLANK